MYTPVRRVCSPYPKDLRENSHRFLQATLELLRPIGLSRSLAQSLSARYPVHAQRAREVAASLGSDPLDVFTGNLCYDALMGSSLMGCSTMALATDQGPLLARNMDWFPEDKIARASCLVEEDYGLNAGFVGMVGAVTAWSKRGFAICLNAVGAGADPTGYPMLLFLRDILDSATGYDAALTRVRSERLMSGGIITLVGRDNDQRAIVERTPRQAAVRLAQGDEPLMATNHFRSLARPEACGRHDYLAAHAGKKAPLEILTHRQVLQSITAQRILLQPATERCEMYVPTALLVEGGVEAIN